MKSLLIAFCVLAVSVSAKDNGDLDVARRLENAFVKVAEQASSSVVVISCSRKHVAIGEGEEGGGQMPREFEGTPFEYFFKRRGTPAPMPDIDSSGSGIVYRKDGFILTNQHVVDGADKIKVRLKDGREFAAKIVGVDERTDVAILKVEASDLPSAQLGDSDKIRVGQWAIAIGAPYELDYSFTVGFISAKGRSAVFTRSGSAYEDYIQTDAAINPGNSGGPLCDIEGRVVGINTLIRGLNRGIGFAIPINMARPVADQLVANGKVVRPWLGIAIESLSQNKEMQELTKLKNGVVVQEIRPDTPAAKSDLKPADVITSVDGVPVNTLRELQQQVLGKKIGQKVMLDVVRDGKAVKVSVQTAEMKDEVVVASRKPAEKPKPESAFGITVQTLTKALAKELNIEQTDGVVVTEVAEDSLAAEKGVQRGDLIIEVDRHPVKNATDFKVALSKADAKKGVLIYLKRGASSTFVVLKEK
jgi:Do/DeqQ family serine protease